MANKLLSRAGFPKARSVAEETAGDRVDRLVVTVTSLASLGAAAYAVSGLWRGQGSGAQIAPVSALSVGLLNAALLWWLWGGARAAARAVALGIALAAGAGACFWGLAGRGLTPEMMPATGFLLMGSAVALCTRCATWGGDGERWVRRAGAALAAGLALTALLTGLVRLTGAMELFPGFRPFSRGGSALAQFCLNLAILGALVLGAEGVRRGDAAVATAGPLWRRRFMFIVLAAFAGATGLAGWGYLRISLQDARRQAGVTLAAVADAKAEALAQWHGERVKDVWALARSHLLQDASLWEEAPEAGRKRSELVAFLDILRATAGGEAVLVYDAGGRIVTSAPEGSHGHDAAFGTRPRWPVGDGVDFIDLHLNDDGHAHLAYVGRIPGGGPTRPGARCCWRCAPRTACRISRSRGPSRPNRGRSCCSAVTGGI